MAVAVMGTGFGDVCAKRAAASQVAGHTDITGIMAASTAVCAARVPKVQSHRF